MNKFLIIILLFVFLVNDSLGSPLVFKVTKEIDTRDFIELGSFDATKYRQIRIGIKAISIGKEIEETKYAQLIQKRAELTVKLQNLKALYREKHPEVVDTKNQIDKVNEEISEFINLKVEKTSSVLISGIEGMDEINLFSFDEINLNRSIIIDSPLSKISVKILGKGKYSLYVWGL